MKFCKGHFYADKKGSDVRAFLYSKYIIVIILVVELPDVLHSNLCSTLLYPE